MTLQEYQESLIHKRGLLYAYDHSLRLLERGIQESRESGEKIPTLMYLAMNEIQAALRFTEARIADIMTSQFLSAKPLASIPQPKGART